jgi:hypothetical protein
MKYLVPIVLAAALAGCGDTESAEEVREDAATVEPVRVPVADATPAASPTPTDDGTLGSDRVVLGSWTSKNERGTPIALFGQPDTDAAFSVRCEEDTLIFARSALLPASEAAMRIMAGVEQLPQVTARLPAADSFAGTLARTSEPIAVAIGDGGEAYRMPSSPALRGVVAGCIAGV